MLRSAGPVLLFWDPVGDLANAVMEAIGNLYIWFFTFWLHVPFASVRNGGNISPSEVLQGKLFPIVVLVAVGGLLAAAGRLALTRKVDPMMNMVKGILTLVIVTFGGLVITDQLLQFSDDATWYILDLDSTSTKVLGNKMTLLFIGSFKVLGPFGFIVIGCIVLLLGFVQLLLMLLREGAIILLAGALPLAAVGTMIPGTNWFRKVTSWMLAFILYKPVAALVYLAAFAMISSTGDGADGMVIALKNTFIGLIMLCLAIVALPMMMKLFDWTTGHVAGGSGAAMISGAASANVGVTSIQTGRTELSGGGGGGGGDGSGGSGAAAQGQAHAVASNMGAMGAGSAYGPLLIAQGVQQLVETGQKVAEGAAGAMGPPEDGPPSNKNSGD